MSLPQVVYRDQQRVTDQELGYREMNMDLC